MDGELIVGLLLLHLDHEVYGTDSQPMHFTEVMRLALEAMGQTESLYGSQKDAAKQKAVAFMEKRYGKLYGRR